MLDSRPRGREFEPQRPHCLVSLSKNINPGLVLVQPRNTPPFITERLLMGRKESNQIKTIFKIDFYRGEFLSNTSKVHLPPSTNKFSFSRSVDKIVSVSWYTIYFRIHSQRVQNLHYHHRNYLPNGAFLTVSIINLHYSHINYCPNSAFLT